MPRRRRESQGGYALLMVFLMAAIVALMLYQQLPRVAFETERDKEQLLVDRGEQYIRAIQLYYLANNRRYPTSIDDLEKKEKRFLRRRYVDPYTGKDEWRIIHTNGGFLTDSLVQKPPTAGDSQSQLAANTPGNTSPADGAPQVNAAVLQRPSDRPLTPLSGFEQPTVAPDPSGQPGNAPNAPLPPITLQAQQGPGALPPITLQPGATQPGLPPITLLPAGTTNGQQLPGPRGGAGAPLFPGQPTPGGLPGGIQTPIPPGFQLNANGQLVPITPVPGQSFPGQPQGLPGQPQGLPGQPQGIPGQPQGILGQPQGIPGQPQGFPGQPQGFPTQPPGILGQPFTPQPVQAQPQFPNQPNQQPPSQQFQNQPGAAQPGSPNAALNLINQLLTNPRQTTSNPVASGGNQVGAIAGIASTHKGPSIKVYKDQSQYELWEFVFTPTASTVPGGANPGAGIPQNGPGMGGPGQPGAPSTFAPSGTFAPGGGQQTLAPGPGR